MSRNSLGTLALVITAFYGLLFGVIGQDLWHAYAVVGGVVVAAAWVSVGRFGRQDRGTDPRA